MKSGYAGELRLDSQECRPGELRRIQESPDFLSAQLFTETGRGHLVVEAR